jgi:prepilin-type N-terminal cleavage/methylation domain-containing protein
MTNRHGLTLVEMLMALAIVALLLAAVAVAMNGSFISMRENDRLLALAQVSRWNLSRMAADIRTADAISTTSSSLTITPPANPEGLTQICYLLQDGDLCCQRTISGVTQTHVLLSADDPIRASSLAVATLWEDSVIRSVTVTLGLNQEGRSYSFTASASPRRNQDY